MQILTKMFDIMLFLTYNINKGGEGVYMIYDLISHFVSKKDIYERGSFWKDDLLESERELIETLSESQKKMLNSFKMNLINHMDDLRFEDCEKFALYGILIGREIENFEVEIKN